MKLTNFDLKVMKWNLKKMLQSRDQNVFLKEHQQRSIMLLIKKVNKIE